MDSKDLQQQISESVARRGYRDGWTAAQFLARQVCKAVEELAETTLTVAKVWPGGRLYWPWQQQMNKAGMAARLSFDDPAVWRDVVIEDIDALKSEAADMMVVLACLAETISEITSEPFDLLQAARDKAAGDEGRGGEGTLKDLDKSSNLNYTSL